VADAALPVFLYLRRLAADGRVIYSDDTRVKILSCLKEDKKLKKEERLRHHQRKSGPVMSELKEWIEEQFRKRQVEPNSGLGQALRYVLNHWEGVTRFLSVADCPLDNNAAERALKRAVLLRKNALFYKNEHGASVGAILMSLIETCRLDGVGAWAYLLWLMRHRAESRANPSRSLPWNYARGESEEEPAALAA
jgi:transposase